MFKIISLIGLCNTFELNQVTDQDPHSILDQYLERDEPAYNWFEIENSTMKSVNGGTIHFLNVTSQQWLDESKAYGPSGDLWTHHVAVNIPKNLKYTNISTAYVTGSCNENADKLPKNTDEDIIVADELSHLSGMISITVFQVPNCHIVYPSDPTLRGRSEDAMIAWAWKQFHEEPDNYEWLPILPMAKAAMQSMRAAQEFVNEELKVAEVESWIVSGASKRGWTTWMVGLSNCESCVNISAIIPLVPIVPNLIEDVHRQWQSYGGWTFAFKDYTDAGIMQYLDDDIFGSMMNIIDPIYYEDRLAKIPKLIMVTSDDEFMMFDWTQMYIDQIQGETQLLIVPNAEHSMATGIPDVISAASTFARSIAEGHQQSDRPSFEYSHSDGEITVTIPEGGQKPKSVMLRHAETMSALRRDFRWIVLAGDDNKNCSLPWIPVPSDQEQQIIEENNLDDDQKLCLQLIDWHKEEIKESDPGVYVAKAPEPKKDGHWVGYYVEVIFDGDTEAAGHSVLFKNEYIMSTPGFIIPDTLPFPDCHAETCTNTLV